MNRFPILCLTASALALLVCGCASTPAPEAAASSRPEAMYGTDAPGGAPVESVKPSGPTSVQEYAAGLVFSVEPGADGRPMAAADTRAQAQAVPMEVFDPPDLTRLLGWGHNAWFGPDSAPRSFVTGSRATRSEMGDPICPPAIALVERWDVEEVIAEMSGPLRRSTVQGMARAGLYLPMIKEVLRERGLPEQLAYLPMVESHYLPRARSRANAVGLWQFIASTARLSGLRVDWWVDERLDPEAATHAAARHLEELYTRFGDWELVLAAYNAGPNGIARSLERENAQTYWELAAAGALQPETRRYVPKFYAAVALFTDPGRYGLKEVEAESPLAYDTVWVEAPVSLDTVARLGKLGHRELKRLNPALFRGCTPPGTGRYALRLPSGAGPWVEKELAALAPSQRLDFLRHRVRSGESVWTIARRYGTRMDAITEINRIRDARLIRPGQELVIPLRRAPARAAGPKIDDGRLRHRVRSGETVWQIAQAYEVSVPKVLAWNRLGRRGLIRPGQQLVVSPPRPAGPDVAAGDGVYVVEQGDTLWAIARRSGVGLEDLRRWNGLDGGALLRPGDRIRLSSVAD